MTPRRSDTARDRAPSDATRARPPWWAWGCAGGLTARDRRVFGWANLWIVLWSFTSAFAYVLLSGEAIESSLLRDLIAVVPIAVGVVMVLTYSRFLRGADELLRKIHLEALAVGAGFGLLFLMGWQLLQMAGAPEVDLLTAALVILLVIAAAQWSGTRRYS